MPLPPSVVATLQAWQLRLANCSDAPLHSGVPSLDNAWDAPEDGMPIFYIRSDASRDNARTPALGGVMGGAYWHYPLSSEERTLPISTLEFAAAVAAILVFANMIPLGALVVLEVDALTTPGVLRYRRCGEVVAAAARASVPT